MSKKFQQINENVFKLVEDAADWDRMREEADSLVQNINDFIGFISREEYGEQQFMEFISESRKLLQQKINQAMQKRANPSGGGTPPIIPPPRIG